LDREMIEQVLHVGIAVHVDIGDRIAVARQKRPEAQRVKRVSGADQYNVAGAVRDALCSPENERPQKYLPQFGIGLHQAPQVGARNFDQFAGFAHTCPYETAAPRKQVDSSGEAARLMPRDHLFPIR
jgi:hypothetical protein